MAAIRIPCIKLVFILSFSLSAEMRLAGGSTLCTGRVEVLFNQRWGTICDNGWDLADANVVCREVGCGSALGTAGAAKFGQGTGPIWMDQVNCTGEEDSLRKCPPKIMREHSCSHSKDAGVECAGNNHKMLEEILYILFFLFVGYSVHHFFLNSGSVK